MMHLPSYETRRRGAVVPLFTILLIPLLGMLAFSIDLGYIALVAADLQTVADAAALALSPRQPPHGSRNVFQELGPERFGQWIAEQKRLLITDTTFRDAQAQRGTAAATSVGQHEHQKSRISRCALRRGADRPPYR